MVLTNPPFDLPAEHLEHILQDYVLFKQYSYAGADVLYLERCYELLKPGGRMAIVVPHRFVDGDAFTNLRKWILDNMIVKAVIGLPIGIFKPFGGANARTEILYLIKPSDNRKPKGHTLMSTVRNVGFKPGIQEYKQIPENDLDTIVTSPQFFDLKEEEKSFGF